MDGSAGAIEEGRVMGRTALEVAIELNVPVLEPMIAEIGVTGLATDMEVPIPEGMRGIAEVAMGGRGLPVLGPAKEGVELAALTMEEEAGPTGRVDIAEEIAAGKEFPIFGYVEERTEVAGKITEEDPSTLVLNGNGELVLGPVNEITGVGETATTAEVEPIPAVLICKGGFAPIADFANGSGSSLL